MFWRFASDPSALLWMMIIMAFLTVSLPTALGFIAERYSRKFGFYWAGLTAFLVLVTLTGFLVGFSDTVAAVLSVSVVSFTAFGWGVLLAVVPRREEK